MTVQVDDNNCNGALVGEGVRGSRDAGSGHCPRNTPGGWSRPNRRIPRGGITWVSSTAPVAPLTIRFQDRKIANATVHAAADHGMRW